MRIIVVLALILMGLVAWYFSSEFRRELWSANQGDPDAQYFVAQTYYDGTHGIQQNLCRAHQWWFKAAQQEHKQAKIALGNRYISQSNASIECIEPDAKAIYQYILLATEYGNYKGYYTLAEHYTKDIPQKINYLESGALHDDTDALYALSSMYFSRNQAYSLHLLEKAAELGDKRAQTFLGDIHAGLTYTPKYKDLNKALEWYEKAAEKGDNTAQKNLALLYLYGQGAQQDYEKAAYYFKKSADQNDLESQLILAMLVMYDRGLSIHEYGSKQHSIDTITELAQNGYVEAQVELGRLYLLGLGVLQNYQTAAEWFQKAVNQSDRLAKYQLGLLYATGNGVPKNYKKAKELFYQSRYTEYLDTSMPSGKGILDEGYPYFRAY